MKHTKTPSACKMTYAEDFLTYVSPTPAQNNLSSIVPMISKMAKEEVQNAMPGACLKDVQKEFEYKFDLYLWELLQQLNTLIDSKKA